MTCTGFRDYRPAQSGRRRAIGPWGTCARVLLGLVMFGSVLDGHLVRGFHAAPWLLGLAGFPVLLLGWQWARAGLNPRPLQATSLPAAALNIAVFFALYLTPLYFGPLSVTSDAALLFYGASMLFAAVRGYGGCEVLAFSNWVLRRDDQVGCLLFAPLDHLERGRRR